MKKFLSGFLFSVMLIIATLDGDLSFLKRIGVMQINSITWVHTLQDIARLLLPFLAGATIWYIYYFIERQNKKIQIQSQLINKIFSYQMKRFFKNNNEDYSINEIDEIKNDILKTAPREERKKNI